MRSVIFLAPPAAGKGTLSEYLIKNYGYIHLSTGDILREKAKTDQSLAEFLKTGKLVSDAIMMDLMEEALKKLPQEKPFILDGVPRTLQQAQKIDIILDGLNRKDIVVIFIDVDKDTLINRVVGRRVCKKCHRSYNVNVEKFKPKVSGYCDDCKVRLEQRIDDTEEAFKVRYETYLESTYPIVAYYKEKGCLKVIQNKESDQTETLKNLRGVLSEH